MTADQAQADLAAVFDRAEASLGDFAIEHGLDDAQLVRLRAWLSDKRSEGEALCRAAAARFDVPERH